MPQETKHVTLQWLGDLRFEGGAPGGPTELIDGDNAQAPGPMLQLLLAAASCSAADVVVILKKMQTTLESLRLEVAGVRREQEPRRYVSIHLVYHVAGAGIDEAKARRAIDLSIEKYCSVMHTLAPDVRITYDLRLG
jgi:putative redox protein